MCIRDRLMGCARRALEGGFEWMCTTLTISPHKDPLRINAIGRSLAKMNGLMWEERIWRKGGGFVRSAEMSRGMGLYRQTWCGCQWAR
ncbi:MAG: epoxyqueuosine reductase QueH, partial [Thermanaerothrix sp.]|nr:epoxyqueuosine reductase QueH [Thermanaerothrix sp.]